MTYRFLTAALINTLLASVCAASTSSSASSGFSTAQLTDSKYNGTYWDPVTGKWLDTWKDSKSETKFNFRGQRADASASVKGLGQLKASALVSSINAPIDELRSSSSASFSDGLRFDVAGMAGQNVLVFMRASVNGIGSASGAAYGYSDFQIGLGGGSSYSSGSTSPGWNYGFLNTNEVQRQYRIFMVKVGELQGFNMRLSSTCNSNSFSQGGSCTIDATASFLGIEALATLNGDEITNFKVASSSGLNYLNPTAPVPEPETYALMLAGLGMIGAYTRRKVKQA